MCQPIKGMGRGADSECFMPWTPRDGGGAIPGRTSSNKRVGHGLEGGGRGREGMGMLQEELQDAHLDQGEALRSVVERVLDSIQVQRESFRARESHTLVDTSSTLAYTLVA